MNSMDNDLKQIKIPESVYRDMEKLSEFRNHMQQVAERMEPSIRAYQQLWRHVAESLQPAFEKMQQAVRAIAPVVEQMQEIGKKIAPRIKYFLIETEHFYISDEVFFKELDARHPRTTDKQLVLGFIIDFYSQDDCGQLKRLFSDWESYPFAKKRIAILGSCRKGLHAGLQSGMTIDEIAFMIIPTLIAQLDGLLKDFYLEIIPGWQEINKDRIKHHEVYSQDFINTLPYFHLHKLLHITCYLFYFKTGVYKTTENEKEFLVEPGSSEELEEYLLDRNAIQHGENTTYGSAKELIRLVLCLDTIIKTISDLIVTNEAKSHEN